MSDNEILILNPLKSTLRHYERELVNTLKVAGYHSVSMIPVVQADGVSGIKERLRIAAASLIERTRLGLSIRGQLIIVTWPMFGYLDPLSLWILCRRNRVHFILHDPTPLRHELGHSRLSRHLFKLAIITTHSQVIYHTELAQKTGQLLCGISGVIAPHPILTSPTKHNSPTIVSVGNHTIRVLGQYKQTRAVGALEAIARDNARGFRLEIHGRGWPPVKGWAVSDRFVSEGAFDSLLQSSNCVVIPYDSFFQSGVAVRSLEHGVPVVAPRHEHIVELYGSDWPGLVDNENDWYEAILRVLAADRRSLEKRVDEVRTSTGHGWSKILDRQT
ncbi:glycosyltransferase [Mycolicibacterium austroafricanum]|uniref:glycosyltransferase n=1 Tax=Mycolicibacterium austroafricanum TaxID=39687 RepID=UPI0011AEAFDA|nr:glycosyltransferase [Mycolicibacterium austroafricanum]QZY47750.1 glycosyltransferase [Mycolicibacterium austroafricanum]